MYQLLDKKGQSASNVAAVPKIFWNQKTPRCHIRSLIFEWMQLNSQPLDLLR
jgi:hypothetical protein